MPSASKARAPKAAPSWFERPLAVSIAEPASTPRGAAALGMLASAAPVMGSSSLQFVTTRNA
ncbi:hypothetical protein ACFPRL_16080 [Pseudoclavibacter helvolus]